MNWRVLQRWTATGWSATPTRTPRRCWAARPPCSTPSWTTSPIRDGAAHRRRPGGHDRVLPRGGQVPPATGTASAACGWTPSRPGTPTACCPECGKPLTVGVLHRVEELADRPAGYRPPGAAGFTHLVQLPEILGEILGVGPKSKKVDGRGRTAGRRARPGAGASCATSRSTRSPASAASCSARASPGCAAARCAGRPATTASTA